MKFLIVTIVCCIGAVAARSIGNRDNDSHSAGLPYNEELVVASSINIRPKGRNEIIRQKRQFGGFGQSQSAANANAYNQQFGPNGFGASAANAGAQGFQSQGPLGKIYHFISEYLISNFINGLRHYHLHQLILHSVQCLIGDFLN
ncbi:hypothetical protein ACKWTF_005284 [Chironomus riparius]